MSRQIWKVFRWLFFTPVPPEMVLGVIWGLLGVGVS